MVGENLVCYLSQMARIAFKLSNIIGENFACYLSQMGRITFKFSTMIEEKIESYLHQTEELLLNCPPWLEKILYVTCLNG